MTVILAMFTHRQRTEVAVLVGALLGALLYFGSFYLLALSLPTLLAAGGLLMLVNYVIFGAVAGWVYKRLEPYFHSASPGGSCRTVTFGSAGPHGRDPAGCAGCDRGAPDQVRALLVGIGAAHGPRRIAC